MQHSYKKNSNDTVFHEFLGAPTDAKASGLAFSLSAIVPIVLAFIFLFVLMVTGVEKMENHSEEDWYLYINYFLPQLSFGLVALLYLYYKRKSPKTAIIEQKCSLKYFLWATLLQIGLLSLSELNTLFLKFLSRFGYVDSPILLPSMDGFGFIGVLFVVALLPAVFEEIFFRGVLLKGLKSFGKWGSVFLCGALFALYHQNPAQTVYQFFCGAAFALVALRSRSILPTALSHFLNNALILILTKAGISGYPTPVFVTILVVSVLCLIASLVYLIFIDKDKIEETEKTTFDKKTECKNFFLFALIGIVICAVTWVSVFISGL